MIMNVLMVIILDFQISITIHFIFIIPNYPYYFNNSRINAFITTIILIFIVIIVIMLVIIISVHHYIY
jgi:hypothetical protein